jgi:hypothetical protein
MLEVSQYPTSNYIQSNSKNKTKYGTGTKTDMKTSGME